LEESVETITDEVVKSNAEENKIRREMKEE